MEIIPDKVFAGMRTVAETIRAIGRPISAIFF